MTALHNAAAARARDPALFAAPYAVPDTLDGRFDALALHIALLMIRLEAEPDGKALNQALFDRTFRAMDQSMRQAGVGDLSVPKKMKKMMTAFNGRLHAYRAALATGEDAPLAEAALRNLYGGEGNSDRQTQAAARYIRLCHTALAGQGREAILAGHPGWPAPSPEVEKDAS